MKRQIVKTVIGLLIGIILVIIFKIASSNGIKIADFVPLIGMAIYLGYENYKVTKQNRDIMKSKIEAINNHQAFHMTIF
jgi:xanthosine utilization system XapX-like protein